MEQAKGELVPGGLALIIGSSGNHPETIGMVVELTNMVGTLGWHWVGCPASFTRTEFLMPINPSAGPLETTPEQEKCTHA